MEIDISKQMENHPSAIMRDPSKYEITKEDFNEVVRKRSE